MFLAAAEELRIKGLSQVSVLHSVVLQVTTHQSYGPGEFFRFTVLGPVGGGGGDQN